MASYKREGINHHWQWGPNSEYKLLIKPDGTGLYYDFTGIKNGHLRRQMTFLSAINRNFRSYPNKP